MNIWRGYQKIYEQDDTFREKVFTEVMGNDTHGRVRMYGTCVTPSQLSSSDW